MKLVKKTKEYSIYQKRSDRYAVKGADRSWILGDEKVTILINEGLMKKPEPKPEPEPEATEETTEAEGEAQAEAEAPEEAGE